MKNLSRLLVLFALLFGQAANATIINSLPYNLTNGSLADATQVMANYNQIVNNTNTNAAHNSANSDITSITGLTTPLANTYGGTVIYTGSTTGGSANVQTLTSVTPSNFALTAGNIVSAIAGATNSGATTLNVNSQGATAVKKESPSGLTALIGGEIVIGQSYLFYYDGTQFVLLNSASGITNSQLATMAAYTVKGNATASTATPTDISFNSVFPIVNTDDFRLTLTTGLPVTTGDVTGATTIYLAPYNGNQIALYNGSTWVLDTSAQVSLALGTLTSGLPYDVFVYDTSGTPTLVSVAWTSGTARATALVYQNGVLVESGTPANRYVGTFYTTATTTTEDSVANRYLFNYYNRVSRPMKAVDSTSSWSYTTATFREARAQTTNQLNFVVGVSEDLVEAQVQGMAVNNSPVSFTVGIGLNSTSSNSATTSQAGQSGGVVTSGAPTSAEYKGFPAVGVNYLSWLEYSTGSGTTTWYGASFAAQAGISGMIRN